MRRGKLQMPLKGLNGCPIILRKQLWSHCHQNLPATGSTALVGHLAPQRRASLALRSVLSVHLEQKTQIWGDDLKISNEVKITAVLDQISSYFFNQHLLYEYITVKISEIWWSCTFGVNEATVFIKNLFSELYLHRFLSVKLCLY